MGRNLLINKGWGARLKSERERIALNQTGFSEKVGVSRRTQVAYEAETSSPDITYLRSAEELGLDIYYVLTGERLEIDALMSDLDSHHHLLIMIALKLGIDTDAMERLIFDAWQNEEWRTSIKAINDSAINRRLDDLIAQSTFARKEEVDLELLSEVLETTEAILNASIITLPISKKARVIALLYRTFLKNKQVDKAVVQDAILVAAE